MVIFANLVSQESSNPITSDAIAKHRVAIYTRKPCSAQGLSKREGLLPLHALMR